MTELFLASSSVRISDNGSTVVRSKKRPTSLYVKSGNVHEEIAGGGNYPGIMSRVIATKTFLLHIAHIILVVSSAICSV